jgi:hypothetical protein
VVHELNAHKPKVDMKSNFFNFVKEDISFLEDYKLNGGCDPCVVNILSKKLWNMQLWSILDFKVAMLA